MLSSAGIVSFLSFFRCAVPAAPRLMDLPRLGGWVPLPPPKFSRLPLSPMFPDPGLFVIFAF